MILSDKGKAIRALLSQIEESDAKLKKLTEEILFEFDKKEMMVVMLKTLTKDI